jgi:hypothetical protein
MMVKEHRGLGRNLAGAKHWTLIRSDDLRLMVPSAWKTFAAKAGVLNPRPYAMVK